MKMEWVRVTGPDLDEGNAKRAQLNQVILKTYLFIKACELTGARPTLRQASKYRRKKGLAYKGI